MLTTAKVTMNGSDEKTRLGNDSELNARPERGATQALSPHFSMGIIGTFHRGTFNGLQIHHMVK